MIKISKTNDKILISGHSEHDICAAISSIVYTGVNFLDKYDTECIDFEDNTKEDYVLVNINRHDETIDMIIDTMIDMFRDVIEQVPSGSISLEVKE